MNDKHLIGPISPYNQGYIDGLAAGKKPVVKKKSPEDRYSWWANLNWSAWRQYIETKEKK